MRLHWLPGAGSSRAHRDRYEAAGQPCEQTFECAARLTCAGGTCQAPAAKGAACGGSGPDCIEPYLCKNGVCTAPADLGQPCDEACLQTCDPDHLQCAGDLTCDWATRTCKPSCAAN